MTGGFLTQPVDLLLRDYPGLDAFFRGLGLPIPDSGATMAEYASAVEDETLEDKGLDRCQLMERFGDFIRSLGRDRDMNAVRIESIEIIGGHDKSGRPEGTSLMLRPGDTVSIVGPTGSGKSRLLADIEWMAQGDTQTGRKVLLNGIPPNPEGRYSAGPRLVAQLSQNMNFVMDLTVAEFVEMHGQARMVADIPSLVQRVLDTANTVAGEPLSGTTRVTSLSGGQSRALMIADTALVSSSPVVLIDEIENAGIDRVRALGILVNEGKIVLVATHDPVLALSADRRVVLENGGIKRVLVTTPIERDSLAVLRRLDAVFLEARDMLRRGGNIERPLADALSAIFETHAAPKNGEETAGPKEAGPTG